MHQSRWGEEACYNAAAYDLLSVTYDAYISSASATCILLIMAGVKSSELYENLFLSSDLVYATLLHVSHTNTYWKCRFNLYECSVCENMIICLNVLSVRMLCIITSPHSELTTVYHFKINFQRIWFMKFARPQFILPNQNNYWNVQCYTPLYLANFKNYI